MAASIVARASFRFPLELRERQHVVEPGIVGLPFERGARCRGSLIPSPQLVEGVGAQGPELVRLELGLGDLLEGGQGTVGPAAVEVVPGEHERACSGVHARRIGRAAIGLNPRESASHPVPAPSAALGATSRRAWEDLAQVPLHRAGADVELRADLGVRRPSAASRAICASWAVSSSRASSVRLRTVSPVASSSRRARSANAYVPIAVNISYAVRSCRGPRRAGSRVGATRRTRDARAPARGERGSLPTRSIASSYRRSASSPSLRRARRRASSPSDQSLSPRRVRSASSSKALSARSLSPVRTAASTSSARALPNALSGWFSQERSAARTACS